MARIRTIKPEFFRHEQLAELPPLHRLLFVGLWTLADRFGRLEDRPKRIKVELLPYDNGDVHKMLDVLARAGFIVRYSGDNGGRYIAIPSFTDHQRITGKEAQSPELLPPPPSSGETPEHHQGNIGEAPETHLSGNGETSGITGRERKGKEGNGESAPRFPSVSPPVPPPLVARRRLGVVHESAIGVDVTEGMHRTYTDRLANLGVSDPDGTLRRWYHTTEQAWRGKPTGTAFKFWDARFEELATKKHDPWGHLPFTWRCKHCLELHEVAKRALFESFRCPSLDAVASLNGRPA